MYKRQGYGGTESTYIDLISFTAAPRGDSILLTWETAAEIDNAGFVIYRAITGTTNYAQISGLIPAEGSSTTGASYSFLDHTAKPGKSYDYWLLDIDTTGNWTPHGPIQGRLPLPSIEPVREQDVIAPSAKRAASAN